MCGGGLGRTLIDAALPIIGSLVAPGIGTALGFTAAGTGLGSLLPAVEGAVGGGLGGAAGSANGGGNPFIGGLEGAVGGGLANGGLSAIGDGLSDFADSSGLSSLFGGTAQPTSALSGLSDLGNVSTPDVAAQATSPGNFASGGDYGAGGTPVAGAATGPGAITGTAGGGAGSIGGGTATGLNGGGQIGEDLGNAGSAVAGNTSVPVSSVGQAFDGTSVPGELPNSTPPTDFAQAPTAGTSNFLNNLPSAGAAPTDALNPAVIQASNAAAPGGTDISLNQQSGLANLLGSTSPIAQSGGSMTASAAGGASPLNGLINGGLSYLLGNNNQHGANQISGAAAQANANYVPYLAAGTGAENTLSNLYGNNGTAAQTAAQGNFQASPGYQFALGQGLNAVNANAAAMGNPLSGNNEEAINNYAQGAASQQYNNYINQLQNLASGGMQAAGGTGANLLTGAGAQSQVGQNQANLQNNAIGTGLNALFPTGGFNLSQLFSGGNSGGGAGLLGMLGLN